MAIYFRPTEGPQVHTKLAVAIIDLPNDVDNNSTCPVLRVPINSRHCPTSMPALRALDYMYISCLPFLAYIMLAT